MSKNNFSSNDITELLEKRILNTDHSIDECGFDTLFAAEAYSKLCLDSLKSCRITPDIVLFASKLFFALTREETAAVMLINKQKKIKKIDVISRGYKAVLSEFFDDIQYLCKKHNCKGCVVIFNYSYKGSSLKELYDINSLFNYLSSSGITLIDCIKNSNSATGSIILPFTDKGYPK
ncbi:MAG: hypothetical protein E7578_07380 [Ruminococcaceae bacterium]|nr:hypothetical protein [Oscillospiraceae bacterium]